MLFGGLSYEKIRRYNNSPPYVTARWPPVPATTESPFKFPWTRQTISCRVRYLFSCVNLYIMHTFLSLCGNYMATVICIVHAETITTLRFSHLNECNVSLVTICAVILVMQRLSSKATTCPNTMMCQVHQRADWFFYVVEISKSSICIVCKAYVDKCNYSLIAP